VVLYLKIYVLDTGALLSNWTQKNPDIFFVTTHSVITELENRPSRQRADNLIMTGRLSTEAPLENLITQVKNAALESGDASVLSTTDVELLALGLGKKVSGEKVVVVSTDLAVLNTAANLGLGVLDPNKKMKQRISWIMKCPACEHVEHQDRSDTECPVCGTTMIRKPGKRQTL
jgi:UPF0271 protein